MNSVQAFFKRKVDEEDGVAGLEAHLIGARIVAIDDPPILLQQQGQFLIELLAGEMRAVASPEEVVEMVYFDFQYFAQTSGEV